MTKLHTNFMLILYYASNTFTEAMLCPTITKDHGNTKIFYWNLYTEYNSIIIDANTSMISFTIVFPL